MRIKVLHNKCNMYIHDLPDMNAPHPLGQWSSGFQHAYQVNPPHAHVTTIACNLYMHVHLKDANNKITYCIQLDK